MQDGGPRLNQMFKDTMSCAAFSPGRNDAQFVGEAGQHSCSQPDKY